MNYLLKLLRRTEQAKAAYIERKEKRKLLRKLAKALVASYVPTRKPPRGHGRFGVRGERGVQLQIGHDGKPAAYVETIIEPLRQTRVL